MDAAGTPVEWVEDFFEQKLDPELITHVGQMPSGVLADFGEYYQGLADSAQPGPRSLGHVRPYVPIFETTGHDIPVTISDLQHVDRVNHAVDSIHLHLLYAHSVAITDPFIYINDHLGLARNGAQPSAGVRHALTNYLILLSYLRPLIDTGVVFLVGKEEASLPLYLNPEDSAKRRAAISAAQRGAEQLINEGRADFSDLFPSGIAPDAKKAIAAHAISKSIETLLSSVVVSNLCAGRLDLYLPRRYYLSALRWLLEAARDQQLKELIDGEQYPLSRGQAEELRLLPELLRTTVPDIAHLGPRELIAVRQGEEFELWRTKLRQALSRVATLRDEDLLEDGGHARRILEQELREGRLELERRIKKSGFLTRSQEGRKSLALGLVAALGLAKWIDPIAGLVSLALKEGIGLAWEWHRSRGQNPDVALLQHYLLFSPAGRQAAAE
jgi:hypothetical protein